MRSRLPVHAYAALLLVAGSLGGCSRRQSPLAPTDETIGIWPPQLKEMLELADGDWSWRWFAVSETHGEESGMAQLTVDGDAYRWRFEAGGAPSPQAGELRLEPADPRWLSIRVPDRRALAETPPLTRLAIESVAYTDLVAMLRELTTPKFGAVVTRWPDYPVPVGAPVAQSGEIDLAACLREAVEIWNSGEIEPLFAWQPEASWGVRLAHYAGSIREPPLQIQLTRRAADGSPLVMRIAAGSNYASHASRPYAVRGLSHELGHAALLWGHSPDRDHLLWGAAPPLRPDPSRDERRAVRLLRRLPPGLDLNRYGNSAAP